jgi:serine/threonine protein kinase/tetratricopeptide (TPR) repeat protein
VLEANARKIFLSALERQPGQCAEFVEAACGSNAELRQRVHQLLEAHRELGAIHSRDPEATSSYRGAALPEGPGMVICAYKLLERIGEGGFGIVYMAEQLEPVRRKVALKIIKPGMDTRLVVARFEAERQALALMDHPNIAQVFDGGTTATGRPFFVMELVRGIPITEFCDQNRLPVSQRVELFVTVCKAVQHAHQKGIIHRDLKPSNVLVTMHDDKAVVKVIDFGIAKAVGQQLTEKTLFTNFAQIIGTPLYMSPEQAQMSGLDVDTRSDIYSLGVLLYELLTGTTPFDKERLRTVAFDEIRRIIREEEPPKPSTRLSSPDAATTAASTNRRVDPRRLRQLIRGELDWIVMKCLEKDRNRRYETANGLALDLGRYLKNEHVQACPPSLAYRLRKFTRRHKASLVTAGLLLAIAMVGCAMTIWQALRAASAQAAVAQAELALSEARELAALQRATAIARDLETLGEANSLIESSRSHAIFSKWAKAGADLTAALKLRPDHSSAWVERGQLYARLHLWDLAAADFFEASKRQQNFSFMSLFCHSLLRLRVGDEAGFQAACDRMIKQFDHDTDFGGWESEEITWACLLSKTPIVAPEELVQRAQRHVDGGRTAMRVAALGTALYRAGRYEAALKRLGESKAAMPVLIIWTDAVAAMIYHRLGQPERARAALRSSADCLVRRYELWCDRFGVATSGYWWSDMQGELYFQEAARLVEGVEPVGEPSQWTHRGDSFAALGRNGEARASYQRAIDLGPTDLAGVDRRAELFARMGDWKHALADYERLISEQADDASLYNELAWRLCICPDVSYRDYRRAAELARRAVTLSVNASAYWNTLALALYRMGDSRAATAAVLKSIQLTNAGEVRDWFLLAMCQWHLDQKHRARQLLVHAVRRIPSTDQPEYLAELHDEAKALIGLPESSPIGLPVEADDDSAAYTLLLEIEPGAQWLYRLRVDACIALKKWRQVAADAVLRTKAEPGNPHLWYCEAAARLGMGDVPRYRSVRTGLLAQFEDTKEPWVASHLCTVCAAVPAEPKEAEAMLRLAELGVKGSSGSLRVRGAINYRAGKYEAAVADFERSAPIVPRRAWDWLFLAMAHHKLGHTEQAKDFLNRAEKWIERAERMRARGSRETWPSWWEPLEVEQILKEAQELMRSAP